MELNKRTSYHIWIINNLITKSGFKGTEQILKGFVTKQLTIEIEAVIADLTNKN